MLRKLVVAAVAVAVFLITPYYFFQRLTSHQFGEAEMRRAVEGTWTVELTELSGARRSITLVIEQARSAERAERGRGWIRSAAACGSRSFVRSAEACADLSRMPLTLTALGDDRPASLRGELIVNGKVFEQGTLELELDSHSLHMQISKAGDILEVYRSTVAAARLVRVSTQTGPR